jgi:hypothetical protein
MKETRYNRIVKDTYTKRRILAGPDPLQVEIEALEKVCQLCRIDTELELDHIIPLSKGGKNNIDNRQWLCRKCNRIKKDRINSFFCNVTEDLQVNKAKQEGQNAIYVQREKPMNRKGTKFVVRWADGGYDDSDTCDTCKSKHCKNPVHEDHYKVLLNKEAMEWDKENPVI